MARSTPNLRPLLLLGLLLLCTQLTGCFTLAHAVLSPVLESTIKGAAEVNATPESMGVSTAQYRGFDCKHLAALEPQFVAESNNPANDGLMRKGMGWHVDAIRQVQREQGCTGSGEGNRSGTIAGQGATAPAAGTPFYFYCYATDTDPKVRKTVASTVFEQSVPAMDPMARYNFASAAEAEFKRNVIPSHGVPGAQPSCVFEDTLAKANNNRARFRNLFSGFNLTFVDLAWRPTIQAVPTAAATTGAAAPGGMGYLGVRIGSVDATMAKALGLDSPRGVMVVELDAAAPPGGNGLKPLDVVLEIAGQAVMQPADLQNTVRRMRPGYKAPLRIWRDRSEKELLVVIGATPPARQAAASGASPMPERALQATSAPPAGPPRFCHATLAPVGKPGGVQSAVWEERGPDFSHAAMLRSLAGFVGHVRQVQPGVWHDDIPAGKCFAGSNHCTATALRHFGTSQQINQFCHETREQAEGARKRLAEGNGYAVIEWAPPGTP